MSQLGTARVVERSADDRWIAGVCGGLARHLGAPAWAIRVLFVVATVLAGAGLVAYLLLWAFLPPPGRAGASRLGSGPWDVSGLLGLVSMGIGVVMALSLLGLPIRVSLWVPLLLVGAGVVVLWRQGEDARIEAEVVAAPAGARGGQRATVVRVLLGLALLLLGVIGMLVPRVSLVPLLQALAASSALLAGLSLIALPWIRALATRLQAERIAAARAEERAAMATRVHDSVLQTLTLIQRRADDPREVSRLARAEERALRSWLYAPAGPHGMLAATLSEVVAQAESDYDVRIDLVTVGDVVVNDRVEGLVAATREAVVNAAKHAQASATVYAEVSEGQLEVNVKDRGRGFDPDAVGTDRHGLRESMIGRMDSLGGSAVVRSELGAGTEVRLILPLAGSDD